MIKDHSRKGWIGASDTAYVVGNWNTATWRHWWCVKLGIAVDDINTSAMRLGTVKEHQILDALGIKKRDRQIRIRKYRLRVNLDGEDATTIHEVKTTNKEYKMPKAHWQQCQVEMFATGKKCVIDSYVVTDEDYRNYFLPVDMARHTVTAVEYDSDWVNAVYLPRLKKLAKALKAGVFPQMED